MKTSTNGQKHHKASSLLWTVILLSSGLWHATLAQEASTQLSTGQTTQAPLKGGIEHDEKLAPVPSTYMKGNVFDGDTTHLTPNNVWFPIPAWFAGTWHGDSQKVTFLQDCQTGQTETPNSTMKESMTTSYGMQHDKTGQIWVYVKIPRIQKHEISHGIAYLQANQEEPVDTGEKSKFVIKYLYDQILVNNKNKIQSVTQIQSFNIYTPMDTDMVRMSGSQKSFDAGGNAKTVQRSEMLVKRTAPYHDIDSEDGLNYKKLFIEFLNNTGRQDLLPADS